MSRLASAEGLAGDGRGDAARGFDLSGPCAFCHEGDGRSPGYRLYQRIAAQDHEYRVNALSESRRQDRHQAFASRTWDPTVDLTDRDVRDLAAYYSGLPW
jgi:cytochrome c553